MRRTSPVLGVQHQKPGRAARLWGKHGGKKKKKRGGGAVKPKFKGSAFTFPVPRCRERPKVAAATRTDGTEVPVL